MEIDIPQSLTMCVRKLLWQSKLTITDDKSCVRHWIYDRVDRACAAPLATSMLFITCCKVSYTLCFQ